MITQKIELGSKEAGKGAIITLENPENGKYIKCYGYGDYDGNVPQELIDELSATADDADKSEDDSAARVVEFETPTVVDELYHQFSGSSYFMPEIFDDAIDGVDPITGCIVYHAILAGYYYAWEYLDVVPNLKDRIYGAHRFIGWIQKLTPEDLQGKVPPKAVVHKDDFQHWDYILYGGC